MLLFVVACCCLLSGVVAVVLGIAVVVEVVVVVDVICSYIVVRTLAVCVLLLSLVSFAFLLVAGYHLVAIWCSVLLLGVACCSCWFVFACCPRFLLLMLSLWLLSLFFLLRLLFVAAVVVTLAGAAAVTDRLVGVSASVAAVVVVGTSFVVSLSDIAFAVNVAVLVLVCHRVVPSIMVFLRAITRTTPIGTDARIAFRVARATDGTTLSIAPMPAQ